MAIKTARGIFTALIVTAAVVGCGSGDQSMPNNGKGMFGAQKPVFGKGRAEAKASGGSTTSP